MKQLSSSFYMSDKSDYLDFSPFSRSFYVMDISRTMLNYPRNNLRFALQSSIVL
jgi:hypothetical protein